MVRLVPLPAAFPNTARGPVSALGLVIALLLLATASNGNRLTQQN